MSENKSSLEKLIQKQAKNKYENEDLLNLALAFENNGFDSLFDSHLYRARFYVVPKHFGTGYEWNWNDFNGLKSFEDRLKELFPNYDDYKEKRLKEIENTITKNILEQLSSVEKLLESRED